MDSPDPEQLCLRHTAALFPFLVNLTRNESDARDLLQELFLSLARQPALLRGVQKEREFLFRVAHNLAVDWIRRRESRDRVHEAAGQEPLELFQPEGNPDEDAYRREVSRALGELPAEQRAVVEPQAIRAARTGLRQWLGTELAAHWQATHPAETHLRLEPSIWRDHPGSLS
jgi:RNA polymerase sigma-70 factor (ECF subfamily)